MLLTGALSAVAEGRERFPVALGLCELASGRSSPLSESLVTRLAIWTVVASTAIAIVGQEVGREPGRCRG